MNVNKMAAYMRYTCRGVLGFTSRSNVISFSFTPIAYRGFNIQTCRQIQASLHTHRGMSTPNCILRVNKRKCNQLLTHDTPILAALIKLNSSVSGSQAIDAAAFIPPPDYVPPVPPLPTESVSATGDLVQSLNGLGEPTLQSLGLGSMWPPGIVQQALEGMHVGLGLPWWGCIVLATLVLRTCMFPIVIKAQKMTVHMTNHMPTIQRLQAQFTEARQRGNMMEAMQYGGELGDYMKRNNVKPFGQLMMPLFQVPIFVSVFVGLRGMANLPVESMKTGGCLWFPDLTISQPFYGLPIMTAFTLWMTVEAGVDGLSAQSQTHMMKWFLRAMPLIMLPLISNFPTAMLVYWFTSNSFSLAQVLFLKIPKVRAFFGIPQKVQQPPMLLKKKGFIEGFRESYSNMKVSQQVMERKRLDETNYRKAAQGPVVKTYSYDPTKLKALNSKAKSKS